MFNRKINPKPHFFVVTKKKIIKALFFGNTVKLGYNELGYNELGYNELGYNELGC